MVLAPIRHLMELLAVQAAAAVVTPTLAAQESLVKETTVEMQQVPLAAAAVDLVRSAQMRQQALAVLAVQERPTA